MASRLCRTAFRDADENKTSLANVNMKKEKIWEKIALIRIIEVKAIIDLLTVSQGLYVKA